MFRSLWVDGALIINRRSPYAPIGKPTIVAMVIFFMHHVGFLIFSSCHTNFKVICRDNDECFNYMQETDMLRIEDLGRQPNIKTILFYNVLVYLYIFKV